MFNAIKKKSEPVSLLLEIFSCTQAGTAVDFALTSVVHVHCEHCHHRKLQQCSVFEVDAFFFDSFKTKDVRSLGTTQMDNAVLPENQSTTLGNLTELKTFAGQLLPLEIVKRRSRSVLSGNLIHSR